MAKYNEGDIVFICENGIPLIKTKVKYTTLKVVWTDGGHTAKIDTGVIFSIHSHYAGMDLVPETAELNHEHDLFCRKAEVGKLVRYSPNKITEEQLCQIEHILNLNDK